MSWLKQSTAVTVKMGPFVDDTDGKTAETALTISQADIRLSKNGGAFAQTNNTAGATHDEGGEYGVPLDATDTNTLGGLRVSIRESGALPVWRDFMVVPANVWDSMFGADKLEVDLLQIGGDAQSATDLKDFADAGYDPATNKVEGVKLADTLTTYTGNTLQTGDSFARLGAPAGASIAADIAAVPTATENADELLKRDWTSVTGEAARSALNALRFLRNKWSVAAGTLTVTEEDDSTPAWTAAVSSDAAAEPITGSDPA